MIEQNNWFELQFLLNAAYGHVVVVHVFWICLVFKFGLAWVGFYRIFKLKWSTILASFVSDDAQVQKSHRDAYPLESQKGGISVDNLLLCTILWTYHSTSLVNHSGRTRSVILNLEKRRRSNFDGPTLCASPRNASVVNMPSFDAVKAYLSLYSLSFLFLHILKIPVNTNQVLNFWSINKEDDTLLWKKKCLRPLMRMLLQM